MKILIIELSNLGDAILTYPALQVLWTAFPKGEFHVLADPQTIELFAAEKRIHRVWVWNKRAPFLKQAGELAPLIFQGFRVVVDFRNCLIPLFLIGARRTPVFRKPGTGVHRMDQHLALVRPVIRSSELVEESKETGEARKQSPFPVALPFSPEDEQAINAYLHLGRHLVVISAGSKSHLKRWAPERFAAVADRLIVEHQAQVILVGSEEERPILEQVKAAMCQPVTDVTGKTTIPQLAALLAHARLVITNDSACLHAASAMGVPTVAIFGPTDEKKYGPRSPGSVVVRKQLFCAPCELALCPYNHECMTELPADAVYSSAAKILSSVRPEPFGSARHPERSEGSRISEGKPIQ